MKPTPAREIVELRARLAEADETIRAIRGGEIDALMGPGENGAHVFSLEGAEHAYRVLIESMNEGALTLTDDAVILYANACFAGMVRRPLEQVLGSSFQTLLSAADQAALRPLLKRTPKAGAKLQVVLKAADGSALPVQISIRPLAGAAAGRASSALVVTDMTEARRTEQRLRALTQRVVQVQEAERGRVALELHDNITQLLCAVLFRSQSLVERLAADTGPAQDEAKELRALLGRTGEEVERISRNLRPSVLDQLGLVAALRAACTEFAGRTGVAVVLAAAELPAPLSADAELAFYRILQEALKNVEQHARARHVTVSLTSTDVRVQLAIRDDGIGFDHAHHLARRQADSGLGLLGLRERASYVGATLAIKSVRGAGTAIEVRLPLPAPIVAAA